MRCVKQGKARHQLRVHGGSVGGGGEFPDVGGQISHITVCGAAWTILAGADFLNLFRAALLLWTNAAVLSLRCAALLRKAGFSWLAGDV